MTAHGERTPEVRLVPLRGWPLIVEGQALAPLVVQSAERQGLELRDGFVVIAQKVVSKSEGRVVALADVEPSVEALAIAQEFAEFDKDPRQVHVVLEETRRIVRKGHGVLICETRHGFVCANAGVDLSNAPGEDVAVLLPLDCDASAERLRADLEGLGARNVGVVVSDTFGRPWREGLVDTALGSAGFRPIDDARGRPDLAGRELKVTAMATADQVAAAAGLLMTKDAGVAAVWVEGLVPDGEGRVADLLRDPSNDLFR
jgi:coenzyme F420-0:L-glutamate ligase/coenzyme F420-1:gamma-L-glutamate ligase